MTLPALGESVTEGTVTRWLKKVGDEVAVDEPLLEVSTDKVDTEIPSPVAGTLQEIKVEEDETVEVGAELAIIGDGSAAPANEKAEEPEEPEEKSEPEPEPEPDQSPSPSRRTRSPRRSPKRSPSRSRSPSPRRRTRSPSPQRSRSRRPAASSSRTRRPVATAAAPAT